MDGSLDSSVEAREASGRLAIGPVTGTGLVQ